MRILTVRQPWAHAIIHLGKDVENRVRNIAGSYRGPVAIHVGLSEDKNAFSLSPNKEVLNDAADGTPGMQWWEKYGHIIGVVDLVDVHTSGMECSRGFSTCHEYDLCSPWAEAYSNHLVLANPRPLREPIPYRGALGLRRLDEETTAAVWSQIGEGR